MAQDDPITIGERACLSPQTKGFNFFILRKSLRFWVTKERFQKYRPKVCPPITYITNYFTFCKYAYSFYFT